MPELEFKGKQHIYAHHLSVPYRPLVPDAAKSVIADAAYARAVNNINGGGGRDALAGGLAPPPDGGLTIHGDNLLALKALLPRYAGRVERVHIDPPYSAGNEGWVYSDSVNSPLMRERLKANSPVDGEDLERRPIASVNDLVVICGVEEALNLRPRDGEEDSSFSNLTTTPTGLGGCDGLPPILSNR